MRESIEERSFPDSSDKALLLYVSLRGCTKRPEKPLLIVKLLLAPWANAKITINGNISRLWLREPDKPEKLINGVRPQKPFRTASNS
jgi:hypothetical protein